MGESAKLIGALLVWTKLHINCVLIIFLTDFFIERHKTSW